MFHGLLSESFINRSIGSMNYFERDCGKHGWFIKVCTHDINSFVIIQLKDPAPEQNESLLIRNGIQEKIDHLIEISGVDKIDDDAFKKVTPQVGPQQSKNAKRRDIKKSRRETRQQDTSIHGQTTQQQDTSIYDRFAHQDAGGFEDTIDPSYQHDLLTEALQELAETGQELAKSRHYCSVLKEQQFKHQQQIEEYQQQIEEQQLKHQQQIEEYQKQFELLKLKHQNDQQTIQIQQEVNEQLTKEREQHIQHIKKIEQRMIQLEKEQHNNDIPLRTELSAQKTPSTLTSSKVLLLIDRYSEDDFYQFIYRINNIDKKRQEELVARDSKESNDKIYCKGLKNQRAIRFALLKYGFFITSEKLQGWFNHSTKQFITHVADVKAEASSSFCLNCKQAGDILSKKLSYFFKESFFAFKESFFYQLVTEQFDHILDPQGKWAHEVVSFAETLKHHHGKKVIEMLLGDKATRTTYGGIPFPSLRTVQRKSTGQTQFYLNCMHARFHTISVGLGLNEGKKLYAGVAFDEIDILKGLHLDLNGNQLIGCYDEPINESNIRNLTPSESLLTKKMLQVFFISLDGKISFNLAKFPTNGKNTLCTASSVIIETIKIAKKFHIEIVFGAMDGYDVQDSIIQDIID
ncbi:hypothetical protein DFA_11680 [Cavenderia fasciculata]|uniref:Uncharacterized protein n=1 Tax=Cavenderia fasciculata TaxID=261658 RepID=F4QDX2_CACFS|nr:uncharacterized protein DFA_11680 [Cavenderia fasciculata]EGG13919.1 hypothetical protein DFA_11680 [Cavenderia fasciculata]|eukprot:XP_004350627.1 hypothetical protein DFA_11680 [Cavenderia fasciculata]